jgi:hypothetical protein
LQSKYKAVNMKTLSRNEAGCIFSKEDYIFNIKWKVTDLISQGYSEKIILFWENNEIWYYYAKLYLELMTK